MNDSKLINTLKTFTKKEFKEFEWFISSPLFNKNTEVIRLLVILKKSYPDFNRKTVTHANMSHLLFKKEDIPRFRYVMTDLIRLIEKFIAFKNYTGQEHNYLIQAYKERGLNKYYQQESTKREKTLSIDSTIRDDNYFKNYHELNELSYQYTSENDSRNIDTELQNLVDNLDAYYLSKKLKYSCEIINRMNILNVDYDVSLLNHLIDYVEANNFKEVPSVMVYYQVLKTLREPEQEANYTILKALVVEHLFKFKKEEQNDLYGYLQNYCIKQINSGNNNYLIKLFEIYDEKLTHNISINNDSIAEFDFKNIVTVALRVEKYEWTEKFIDKYQKYLPDDHHENAVNYNKARLYFYLKEYKEGLKHLLAVEFTDIYYSLDSRALLLKTYYELDDVESAASLINAFRIYLKRDKTISDYQKLTYSNFLKIVHQLIRLKMGYKINLEQIEKQLFDIKEIADLTWLNQKIEQLK